MKLTTISGIIIIIIGMISLGAMESLAVHDLFKSIDQDKDNKVEFKEFSRDMKKHAFESMDRDQDQAVSLEEWESIGNVTDTKKHGELFMRIDKDRDRIITFFEFSDYAESNANIMEAFMGLDRDGSNSLSPDEITIRPLFKMITIKFR